MMGFVRPLSGKILDACNRPGAAVCLMMRTRLRPTLRGHLSGGRTQLTISNHSSVRSRERRIRIGTFRAGLSYFLDTCLDFLVVFLGLHFFSFFHFVAARYNIRY